jgi:hypothetical protein
MERTAKTFSIFAIADIFTTFFIDFVNNFEGGERGKNGGKNCLPLSHSENQKNFGDWRMAMTL